MTDLVILWIAHQLLGWGWPPFLTAAWDEVLGVVSLSLVAAAVVNVAWLVADPPWFRHLGQIGLHLISLVVIGRMWEVFPFDLAGGWEALARVVLVVGCVGTVIGVIS
mgnify:CR=1 FL=1